MNTQLDQAKLSHGAIGIADTSSVANLFNSPRIYSKGSVVLHMLRHVLGDSIFFLSLYKYANDPTLKYFTATIRDFQSVCETVSEKNLAFFFQEWLYGDRFPDYNYSWNWKSSGDSSFITLTIMQTNIGTTPSFYTMPIDIRITAAGTNKTFTVFNNFEQQIFIIKCPIKPSAVSLDPEQWILKFSFNENDLPPSTYLLEQNYPNPFNSTTTITYQIPSREQVVLKILTMFLDARSRHLLMQINFQVSMSINGLLKI